MPVANKIHLKCLCLLSNRVHLQKQETLNSCRLEFWLYIPSGAVCPLPCSTKPLPGSPTLSNPASPFSPFIPASPVFPCVPCPPSIPLSPFSPIGPAMVTNVIIASCCCCLPSGPRAPEFPFGPVGPGIPGGPLLPLSPFRTEWEGSHLTKPHLIR